MPSGWFLASSSARPRQRTSVQRRVAVTKWGRRLREPALILGAVLAAAWLAPLAGDWRWALQLGLGIAVVLAVFRSATMDGVALAELGVRVDNFPSASVAFLALTLLPLMAMWELARGAHLRLGEVAVYLGWALLQQFGVVAGFWRHLRPGNGPWRSWGGELGAATLAAGLFALAHAPNVRLMGLVFGAELVWLACFTRFRNLFALALAHSLAAIVVKHELVPHWLSSMKVGLGYWRP
jgi:hypothetical protein